MSERTLQEMLRGLLATEAYVELTEAIVRRAAKVARYECPRGVSSVLLPLGQMEFYAAVRHQAADAILTDAGLEDK